MAGHSNRESIQGVPESFLSHYLNGDETPSEDMSQSLQSSKFGTPAKPTSPMKSERKATNADALMVDTMAAFKIEEETNAANASALQALFERSPLLESPTKTRSVLSTLIQDQIVSSNPYANEYGGLVCF
jgi:hypothetical protein